MQSIYAMKIRNIASDPNAWAQNDLVVDAALTPNKQINKSDPNVGAEQYTHVANHGAYKLAGLWRNSGAHLVKFSSNRLFVHFPMHFFLSR